MRQAVGASEAEAVRVRIVTIREPDSTVSTAIWALFAAMGQRQAGDSCSRNHTGYATGDAAHRFTASELLICHTLSEVFKPVCHE
jgi:hypothetical protein